MRFSLLYTYMRIFDNITALRHFDFVAAVHKESRTHGTVRHYHLFRRAVSTSRVRQAEFFTNGERKKKRNGLRTRYPRTSV